MGQLMDASLIIGQAGIKPAVLTELNRQLEMNELVKLRFAGADRHQRADLSTQLAAGVPCLHVGSVGATALFYRPHPEEAKRKIVF
jgi:RNA-binding protein